MRPKTFIKAAGIVTAFGAIVLAGMFSSSRRARAIDDDDESSESKIRQGFEIAPVPLAPGWSALHRDCQSKNRLTALGTVNGAWLSARKPFRRLINGGENFDHLVDFGQFKAIVDHRFDRSNAEPASRTLELA